MTKQELEALKELAEKATPGPWFLGDWTIHAADREAQRKKEPYWTSYCTTYFGGIISGQPGRKVLSPEYVLQGSGYECDGIEIKSVDADFITASRTAIPKLIEEIEKLELKVQIMRHNNVNLLNWLRDGLDHIIGSEENNIKQAAHLKKRINQEIDEMLK